MRIFYKNLFPAAHSPEPIFEISPEKLCILFYLKPGSQSFKNNFPLIKFQ